MNSLLFTRSIVLALALTASLCLAQSAESGPRPRLKVVLPPVPKTAPIVRTSGASRGGCTPEDKRVFAQAINQPDPRRSAIWTLTSQARPTIWAELPADFISVVGRPYLVILDRTDNLIQKLSIPIPSQPSLIGIQLKQALPKPQIYKWQLKGQLKCNGQILENQIVLAEDWIEYSPPIANLQNQLQQAAPIDQVSLYASNGYWLDALTIVGQQRGLEPNQSYWRQSWSTLMSSIRQPDRLAMPIEFR
jgi:hypothetical protein